MIKNVIVHKDYDGYFFNWVRKLIPHISNTKITTITIDSGPYRPYCLKYEINQNTIHLDFYSAVRAGFGSLPKVEEVAQEIKEKL